MAAYFSSLNPLVLLGNLPGGVAQGIIWGIMALGVYITFRLLDVADLTVDGTFTTGGAVTVMLILAGWNPWAALLIASSHGAGHPGDSCRNPHAVCDVFHQPCHHGIHGKQTGQCR